LIVGIFKKEITKAAEVVGSKCDARFDILETEVGKISSLQDIVKALCNSFEHYKMAQEDAAARSKQTMDAEILAASKKRAISSNANTAALTAPKKKRTKIVKPKAKKGDSNVKASTVQAVADKEVMTTGIHIQERLYLPHLLKKLPLLGSASTNNGSLGTSI
jgi:hypothetical protein